MATDERGPPVGDRRRWVRLPAKEERGEGKASVRAFLGRALVRGEGEGVACWAGRENWAARCCESHSAAVEEKQAKREREAGPRPAGHQAEGSKPGLRARSREAFSFFFLNFYSILFSKALSK